VIGTLDNAPAVPQADPQWTLADSWIWARLQALEAEVDRLFQTYQYGEAGRQIYEFFWSEYADWYLEIAKLQMNEGGDRAYYTAETLVRVFDAVLRMLHPFTPFVTEELWGHLKRAVHAHGPSLPNVADWPESLMVARWPEGRPAEGWEEQAITDFNLVMDVIRSIRNLRAEKKVTPGKRISATICAGERLPALEAQRGSITYLAYLDGEHTTLVDALPEPPQGQVSLVVSGVEVYLPLADLVDVEEERARLTKELEEAQSQVARLEQLLGSPFAQKAPAAVVDKEREKLAVFKETVDKLKEQLQNL